MWSLLWLSTAFTSFHKRSGFCHRTWFFCSYHYQVFQTNLYQLALRWQRKWRGRREGQKPRKWVFIIRVSRHFTKSIKSWYQRSATFASYYKLTLAVNFDQIRFHWLWKAATSWIKLLLDTFLLALAYQPISSRQISPDSETASTSTFIQSFWSYEENQE